MRSSGVHSWPKPLQPGGVPIVIGGHSEAVARRAGRIADGFMPAPADIESITHLVGVMRDAACAAGRDPDSIEVTCSRVNDLDTALALADLGVRRCNILPPSPSALRARLEAYRERVIDPLRERGLVKHPASVDGSPVGVDDVSLVERHRDMMSPGPRGDR